MRLHDDSSFSITAAGIGTLPRPGQVVGCHRAVPSTTLDKTYEIISYHTMSKRGLSTADFTPKRVPRRPGGMDGAADQGWLGYVIAFGAMTVSAFRGVFPEGDVDLHLLSVTLYR